MASDPVQTWLATVDPVRRAAVDRLRAIVGGAAGAEVSESIKWNAPSFAHRGADRVTLNLRPKGTLRLILHRGVKAKDAAGFAFADPAGLAAWPSADRGVVTLRDAADIDANAMALADLVRRWIAANA